MTASLLLYSSSPQLNRSIPSFEIPAEVCPGKVRVALTEWENKVHVDTHEVSFHLRPAIVCAPRFRPRVLDYFSRRQASSYGMRSPSSMTIWWKCQTGLADTC